MNAMTDAMAKAGIKVPSKRERIWRYLKDRGERTAVQLAAEMGLTEKDASVTLSSMRTGGLLAIRRQRAGRGGQPGVYSALGDTYGDALAGAYRTPTKVTDIKPKEQAAPAPSDSASLLALPEPLQSMTVRQLHDTYKQLHTLFGGQ